MNEAAVESALERVRPALAADGFDLRLGRLGPGNSVEVVLEALPNACLDCLVPDDLLIQIVESAMRDEGGDVDRVQLAKRGFDHADGR